MASEPSVWIDEPLTPGEPYTVCIRTGEGSYLADLQSRDRGICETRKGDLVAAVNSARTEGVKDALDRAADRVRGWEFKDGTTGDLAACFRVPCAICGIAIYEGRWIREKGKYYCSPRCHSQAGPPVQAGDAQGGA